VYSLNVSVSPQSFACYDDVVSEVNIYVYIYVICHIYIYTYINIYIYVYRSKWYCVAAVARSL